MISENIHFIGRSGSGNGIFREAEYFLSDISSFDIVFLDLSLPDGSGEELIRKVLVNQAAIDHYGHTKSEFLSMNIRDIRPPEDGPILDLSIRSLKTSESSSFTGNFRHKLKNGSIIHVEVNSNIIDFQGKPAILVIANDITDRILHINAIET
jgi:PAS domain S-box-containing protein